MNLVLIGGVVINLDYLVIAKTVVGPKGSEPRLQLVFKIPLWKDLVLDNCTAEDLMRAIQSKDRSGNTPSRSELMGPP
jgi:hypothetical protein